MTPRPTMQDNRQRILIVMSEIRGKLYAVFALAERLRAANYEVVFCSYDKQRADIEAQGYSFYSTTHLYTESARTWVGDSLLARLRHGVGQLATIQERRYAAIHWDHVTQFQAAINSVQPDLILVDTELHAHIIIAGSTQRPIALINRMMTMEKYANVPPMHFPNTPHVGWSGSYWGIEWAWTKYRLIKARRFLTRRVRKIFADKTAVLRHLAHEVGFDFGRVVRHYQWMMPFSFVLPTLNLTALELDFPHTPRDFYHYVGPVIMRERRTTDATDPALVDLLANFRSDEAHKLIYCAFGAFFKGDDTAFFDTLIAVAEARPQWQFVFGLGGRYDPAKLGALPDNVLAVGWVPQLAMLEKADCMLSATGINTLIECVHYGVPLVAFPFAVRDQLGNAARIRYHGLGIIGDRDNDTAEAILGYLERVLSDTRYEANLAAMREHFLRYEDENAPEHVIDHLLMHP